MAIGWSPKHKEQYPLGDLSHAHFLVLAANAASALGWQVVHLSSAGLIASTKMSMASWGEDVTIQLADSSALIKSEVNGNQIVDWGRNKKNIIRFLDMLETLRASTPASSLDEQYESLQLQFVAPELDELRQPPPTATDNAKSILSLFIPTKGYFVTPIIVILNIVVFLLMVFSGVHIMEPDSESLLKWGANFRPVTLEGEWWRLLTCCFIHIGILHLLLNMYALVYIGALLEPLLGSVRFLVAYLLTGIAASTASLWWHDLTVSAGASGAIFGMYGVFLALLTTNLIEKTARQALLTSIALFVGYNLLFGIKGGIDNAAHIGGLLSGAVIGYALIPALKKRDGGQLSKLTLVVLTIVVLGGSYGVIRKLPNDFGQYDKAMKVFVENEDKALAVYKLPQGAPADQQLALVKSGIEAWHSCDSALTVIGQLQLSPEFKTRNDKLKQYVQLRLQTYRLLQDDLTGAQQMHMETYQELTERINVLIESLNKPARK
ncbi:rhomboid family intramembrane serine protease [Paraflavitalea pollutisoli]|uniref:rhomboid family intramembrane serine protease n=1 Tax=Paraflavitalea pollutisoli TaxID=3034143 RepID=UPI0023EACF28|nr:rhomboid family intramembrane serine protease [Paraflavitalea sp. H1-2-19X]